MLVNVDSYICCIADRAASTNMSDDITNIKSHARFVPSRSSDMIYKNEQQGSEYSWLVVKHDIPSG